MGQWSSGLPDVVMHGCLGPSKPGSLSWGPFGALAGSRAILSLHSCCLGDQLTGFVSFVLPVAMTSFV